MDDFERYLFHDEIFKKCVLIIKQIDNNDVLTNLVGMLRDASKLTSGFELRFLKANKEKDDHKIIKITIELIEKILKYFLSFDNATYSGFFATYSFFERIIDKYDFDSLSPSNYYYDFSSKLYGFAAPGERKTKRLTKRSCCWIFKEIIKSIVQDINDLDEWQHIRNHYCSMFSIDTDTGVISFSNVFKQKPIITFLSYSFDDEACSLYLFDYFLTNGGFLYVDSLLSRPYKSGKDIKNHLNPWIINSSQLLFLRSVHSDSGGIRQWCSWEIGRSFSYCNNYRFIDITSIHKTRNVLLDDFLPFHYVKNGVMF